MKAKEIREMNLQEIKQRLISTEEELFNLRLQLSMKQLENPMKIRESKRHVARLRTILREREHKEKESPKG
jgi:large subunit ribosomal protein L29